MMSAMFQHSEMKMVMETYYEQVPESVMETYNCGVGTAYRTCTRMTTRYRQVAKTRWVNRLQTIVDGHCAESLNLAPTSGHTYLVELLFQQSGACRLHCYEQVHEPAGQFQNRPCPSH